MRFMVLVKADQDTEAGVLPSRELLEEMGNYNEQLAGAGMLLAGEGLQPSSKGARVRFDGARRIVTDGPFAETKELIAGFWMLQAGSLAEARKRGTLRQEGKSYLVADGDVVEVLFNVAR